MASFETLSARRSPGVVGGGDAQCVLCRQVASDSLDGVFAAQSGRNWILMGVCGFSLKASKLHNLATPLVS